MTLSFLSQKKFKVIGSHLVSLVSFGIMERYHLIHEMHQFLMVTDSHNYFQQQLSHKLLGAENQLQAIITDFLNQQIDLSNQINSVIVSCIHLKKLEGQDRHIVATDIQSTVATSCSEDQNLCVSRQEMQTSLICWSSYYLLKGTSSCPKT